MSVDARMNVLVLLPRFPFPATQGDKVRAWGEVTHLAARHRVWLATLCDERPTDAALAEVRGRCADVAIDDRAAGRRLMAGSLRLLSGGSISEGYFRSVALQRRIGGWMQDVSFDAALVFSSGMAVNLPGSFGGRVVLDMNDVDSRKWRHLSAGRAVPWSWLYAWEAGRLARWERRCAERADVNVLVNERESAALAALAPTARRAVVRTGVQAMLPEPPHVVPAEPIVGFVGSMSYAPNVDAVLWFAREIWPLVRRCVPNAEWHIVGRDPARAVRALHGRLGVTVTGTVEDVGPYLRRIRAMVVPHRSAIGVQTKLIEAMSRGKASVVTPEVAEGITTGRFEPFLVGGEPVAFAAHVCQLLACDGAVRRVSEAAWSCADAYYRADAQLVRLESLLVGDAPVHASVVAERPTLAVAT